MTLHLDEGVIPEDQALVQMDAMESALAYAFHHFKYKVLCFGNTITVGPVPRHMFLTATHLRLLRFLSGLVPLVLLRSPVPPLLTCRVRHTSSYPLLVLSLDNVCSVHRHKSYVSYSSLDLGGGVYQKDQDDDKAPNYNLIMSVNHPEWVYRWTKYAFPTLPKDDHEYVKPYIRRHRAFLAQYGILPAGH